MSNYSYTDLRDRVLLWLHGRRLGIKGDGAFPATQGDVLVLDGVTIGSTRSGANSLKQVATMRTTAGAVTVPGVLVGDNVELVLSIVAGTDVTSSFETTVSVAGQVQQTGTGTAVSGLFFVQPQS